MTDDEARCGVCGRLLTDPESKKRRMGPVCTTKAAAAAAQTERNTSDQR